MLHQAAVATGSQHPPPLVPPATPPAVPHCSFRPSHEIGARQSLFASRPGGVRPGLPSTLLEYSRARDLETGVPAKISNSTAKQDFCCQKKKMFDSIFPSTSRYSICLYSRWLLGCQKRSFEFRARAPVKRVALTSIQTLNCIPGGDARSREGANSDEGGRKKKNRKKPPA